MTHAVPHIVLGDPVVVAQGPVEVQDWGPYQFPVMERLADGRIHLQHHLERDSAKDYGLPVAHHLSGDNGCTWQPVAAGAVPDGLRLPNGDDLKTVVLRPRPAGELRLPEYAVMAVGAYGGQKFYHFRLRDLPEELQDGYHFARRAAGTDAWREEAATVHLPGELRRIQEGVLVFPWFWRFQLAPDGSLWGLEYTRREHCGTIYNWHPVFLSSVDNGHVWDMQGEILPEPDAAVDPLWAVRDGFSEPGITFMPDGSVFCLIRTTDGNGIGPLYWSRSTDNGKTWIHPRFFDRLGVWPQLVTLADGVTLAAYGRPGVYVRATGDPSGLAWVDPVTVLAPGEIGKDSCSYTALLALDAHSALLAYSYFKYPDGNGNPRKTILVRTVRVA